MSCGTKSAHIISKNIYCQYIIFANNGILLNFAPVISNIYFDSKKEPYQVTLFSKNIKLRMLPAFAVFLFAAKLNKLSFPTKKSFPPHFLPKSLIINCLVFRRFTPIYIGVKRLFL
jgi:hypothetical protein